jgi:hypothetical protein
MQRRELLKRLGLLAGGAIILPKAMLAENGDWNFSDRLDYGGLKLLNKKQRKTLVSLCETIIPRTSTPGATDAKVAPFVELMLADCYEEPTRAAFIAGLEAAEMTAKSMFQNSFAKLTPVQMKEIVTKIEAEGKAEKESRKFKKFEGKMPEIFWFLLKSLTLTGFFTSEVGGTQAANYILVPGRFSGAEPVTSQTRSWL